jgi:hypothetical protein
MRDPHVVMLRYRFESIDPTTTYEEPTAVEGENESFEWRLEDDELRLRMKKHFASIDEARRHVAGFIRNWELHAALEDRKPSIRFTPMEPQPGDVVDRDPPPPPPPSEPLPPGSPQAVEAGAAVLTFSGELATVHTKRKYPLPPTGFAASPDAQSLWDRYEGYRQGREPLEGMASFCLSVIQFNVGGRRNAARQYQIAFKVLDKLGNLTSTRGDMTTARKIDRDSSLSPLTDAEKDWVRAAVRAIIRRVGQYDALRSASSLPKITMSDVPNY